MKMSFTCQAFAICIVALTCRQSAAEVRTFQNGTSGYVGAVDTFLDGSTPNSNRGSSSTVSIDLAQGSNNLPPAHGLLRFDALFGYGPNAIPFGSTIHSATLTVNTSNAGSGAQLYRARTTWDDTRTWANSFGGNGIQNDDVDASSSISNSIGGNTNAANVPPGISQIDVTADVAAWSAGAANLGWAMLPYSPNGLDGWGFDSSNSSTVANRPSLAISFDRPAEVARSAPKNVILFVGDGMGVETLRAAQMYSGTSRNFENFPHSAYMTHDNVSGTITDSAASATAMATGVKVDNYVLSMAKPGDYSELTTALEIFQARGKSTGLVTLGSEITDATPAAFGAHSLHRSYASEIATDMLTQTRPNVLFGLTGGMTVTAAQNNGYTVVTTEAQLNGLDTSSVTHASGQFTSGAEPPLSLQTSKALDMLDNNPDGFFLMVENGNPDIGNHGHDISKAVNGVLSLSTAVQTALDWMAGRDDTLILVVADHETGGLYGLVDNGVGNMPGASYTTGGHTGMPIRAFAIGKNADMLRGTIDNTDVFYMMLVPEPGAFALMAAGLLILARICRSKRVQFLNLS